MACISNVTGKWGDSYYLPVMMMIIMMRMQVIAEMWRKYDDISKNMISHDSNIL